MKSISTCLWFDHQAEEAANFYVSIFKNSRIGTISRYGEEAAKVSGRPNGSVMTVSFHINGNEFLALNGGHQFKFTEAISLIVNCESQEEVDEYWEKLTEGGTEVQCGWLKDKYGLSWQIVPTLLHELLNKSDSVKAQKVMKALLQMKKIDIKKLQEAYNM